MRCEMAVNNIMNKTGIQQVNGKPNYFTPTYVLGIRNGRNITVSDMLGQLQYTIKFIRYNFDVDQTKYKETIEFLKICQLVLQNKSDRKPKKQIMKFVIDVFHEIENMHAANDELKKENDMIADALEVIVDFFVKE